MSETRKIVVEILNKDQVESTQQTIVNNENNMTQVNLTALLHPVKNVEKHLLGKSVLLNQAFNVAKSGISQSINLTMNRYFNMKEDYIGQTNFNNFMTSVNLVSSVGTSILGGALVGSRLGVGGAVVGGAIGGLGAGLNLFMGYEGKMSSYYSSLNASNYQTQFGRTRAGLTDNSRGTEN